ncbi:MAG TPA: MotA/TolQ/ExbB proton channel family protein [Vicinamibacterales bacterium]|uniref:MotA/TolQ/ExbB proton channel domain-containing protein n=1 Tax=marine metagenome TaxID=408172 RepID=A0A381XWU1_9ZZZZ|nr:MotA/TolQ/ExbB proton channel family protein [Vicinamibacterales bacterium]
MRTLGFITLALLQVQGDMPDSTMGSGVLDLVARSGLLSRFVLLILILFSVASWAIVLRKILHFRLVESESERFRDVFRRSRKFSEVQAVCGSLNRSPLVGIFQTGYAELNSQLRASNDDDSPPSDSSLTLRSIDALDRALQRAAAVEVNKMESRIEFLATTASITPFIGLFGTVWGIMNSFQGIAATGSSSLGVVAPGIAEALIATAAGLFAAIPAVYFYNHLTHRVKLFVSEMDDFSLEFLNIAERNFS